MAEQWWAIHDDTTGELRSVATVPADPLPPGLAKTVLADRPNIGTHRWNTTTRGFEPIPPPTDDDVILAMARKRRLSPTAAVGKAALKELLDEQVERSQIWEWFAAKVAADAGVPVAAKTAVQGLADAEYAEAKRLAIAWRAAV
jgi:hypothetical protein